MANLAALTKANGDRWNAMAITPSLVHVIDGVAAHLCDPVAKSHYQAVSARTGVPWYIIAVIHEREASQSWKANLAQGDPWNQKSTHVPAGRGPFASWEDAAVDALENCAPHAAKWTDWNAGGALTLLEQYNGLGYANMGRPSPYIWTGSNQYTSGKYTSDGHYDPAAIDRQLGCAPMLRRMAALDASVRFPGDHTIVTTPPVSPPPPDIAKPKPAPAPPPPARNVFQKLGSWFTKGTWQ
jgi:lysozyme family protein